MKEIVVTKCGPEQDRYHIIDGGGDFKNGADPLVEIVVGRAELMGYKIKEVTRLHVEVDATVVVDVDVEGDEDAAFEHVVGIAQAFEREADKIKLLTNDSVGLGIGNVLYWRNEDSGEETYR